MLKTIDPRMAPIYKIKPKGRNLVRGKRCGISRNLGPTARERHRVSRAKRQISIVAA